jgi:hypothetical protein
MERLLNNGSGSGRPINLWNWIQINGLKNSYNYHMDTWADNVYFFCTCENLIVKNYACAHTGSGSGPPARGLHAGREEIHHLRLHHPAQG